MPNTDQSKSSASAEQENTQNRNAGSEPITPLQKIILIAAVTFAMAAAGAFIYAIAYLIYGGKADLPTGQFAFEIWKDFILPNFNTFAVISIGLICAFISLRLFGRAGSLTSQVIRREDRALLEPLLSKPNVEAISQYIRLASLSGSAGTFTYLGFTGLPLATVALTLILLATAIFVNDDDLQKSIFDMAKLTLGA